MLPPTKIKGKRVKRKRENKEEIKATKDWWKTDISALIIEDKTESSQKKLKNRIDRNEFREKPIMKYIIFTHDITSIGERVA